MTAKIFNKKPAFLNFFIKNTGKNSIFNGQIIAQNYNSLKIDVNADHFCENTGIFVKTKVLAFENTETNLSGCARIENNASGSDSDVSFSVMAVDESAKIIMKPTQYIKSIPLNAKHSASLYKNNQNQVEYLRGAGLSGCEIKQVLQEAFLAQE